MAGAFRYLFRSMIVYHYSQVMIFAHSGRFFKDLQGTTCKSVLTESELTIVESDV